MGKSIANKYFDSDWSTSLSERNSKDWPKAIEIIRSRFESRYLKQIRVLIDSSDIEIKYNCGFIVMSIDCLLLETLHQFKLGLYHTDELYRKSNVKAFVDFFNQSTYFPFFKGNDEASRQFYWQIRCGLLHQAESKSQSLINIREKQMVVAIDPTDLSKGLIINRNLFHEAMVNEFEKYLIDLANPDSKNMHGDFLREKCHRKMIAIIS